MLDQDPFNVVGFDPLVIDKWLPTVASVAAPFAWRRVPGGHSNLTYELTDATGRPLIIRRPPLGVTLPKAHDMWREFRIIEALSSTAVPVADAVGYCDDRAVADAHFYVMGKVEGRALYTAEDTAEYLDLDARRRASEQFVHTLAALHSVKPADVGLADLGRPDGHVARQLNTWHGAWNAASPIAGHVDARAGELHGKLQQQIPLQGPGRIVHGDLGPHNAMFSATGDLTAVLDWELATLGDPLADFAYTVNAWAEAGEDNPYSEDSPTALEGFSSRAELIDRYVALTGCDVADLDFYRAFNYYRTASILLGVYSRYVAGQKSPDGVDVDRLLTRTTLALDLAAEFAPKSTAPKSTAPKSTAPKSTAATHPGTNEGSR